MTEPEYEVTDEEAEADFREAKSKEVDTKSMITAYEQDEKDEKEEKKKELAETKDKVVEESKKYRKQ